MALSRITEAVASFTDLTIGDDLTLTDDLLLASDANIIKFGADAEVTLTHVHNTGLLLNSTSVIQFNDASQNIGAPSATVLDINADAEIELNATLVDVNANLDVSGTIVSGGTLTATTSIGIGSAVLTEAELELLDGITAGTAAASKALVLDSDKDIGTIRNLTIDGVFTDGNYTFDTSGNVSGLGTVASGAITSSGIIKTDNTTAATSTTDGSLQTDGGLSVAADAVIGDDLILLSDAAVLSFGANSEIALTHVHNTGLLLTDSGGSPTLQLHNSAESVSSDGSKLILTSNSVAFSLPTADGSSGQTLVTNGSGVLSFATASANTPSSADGQALGSASLEWSDLFLADASTIQFGADQDVTLTHVADTGLLLNTTMVIQFRDSAINIGSPADGDLDINADDEIELNSTLIDINGNVEISGTAAITGIATFTDDIIIGDGKTIGSASDIDAITIASNGQVTLTQTLIGTALDISGNIDVDGTTNLDVVDIDGAVDMATTLQVDGAITSSASATIAVTSAGASTTPLVLHNASSNANTDVRMLLAPCTTAADRPVILSAKNNGSNVVDFGISTPNGGTPIQRVTVAGSDGTIDVETGNILFSTAGKGIHLGVTSATASNLLDDYEEGTFTPILQNSGGVQVNAYSIQVGYYTKVGRLVHASGTISANGLGSTGSGNGIFLGGFPFDAVASSNNNSSLQIGHAVNLNISAGHSLGGFLPANSTNAQVFIYDNAAGSTQLTFGELSADGQLTYSIQYQTA